MTSPTGLLREVARRNLFQTLGLFLGAGWGLLQVVDLFIERGFLPGWIFDGALLALVLGLPVMLATAWVQGGRASSSSSPDTDTGQGEGTDAPHDDGDGADELDLAGLLTWNRAFAGGVVAFALLGVLAAGYMVMRVTGIGAPGTLSAQGTFQLGNQVVLADFESQEEAAPGDLITEALRIDLAQSEAFDLVARGEIVATRRLMRIDDGAPLDESAARELAIRVGVPGVVSGEVGRVGSSYVITSRLLASESGDELASFRQTARDSTEIVDAVDRLAADMRSKVGESLRSVASSESLRAVTTTSLEALRNYSYVNSRMFRGEVDFGVALELLEDAIALDSTFATANLSLAIAINNYGGSQARAAEAAAQAFRHRERLSDRERYSVEAYYYSKVGDIPEAMQAYRRILTVDSTQRAAATNLADLSMYQGRYQDAVDALRGRPDFASQPWWWNLSASLTALGRVDEALAVLDSAAAVIPESYPEVARPYMLAIAGEQEAAVAAVSEMPVPPPGWDRWDGWVRLTVESLGGNLAVARERLGGLVRIAGRDGDVTEQARLAVGAGWLTAWSEGRPDRAVADLDAALTGVDLTSVPAQDRGYPDMAILFAVVDDRARLESVAGAFREGVRESAAPFDWALVEAAEALAAVVPDDEASLARVEVAVRDIHCARCGDLIVGIAAERADRPERAIAAYDRYLTHPFYDGGMLLTSLLSSAVRERLGALYERAGESEAAAEQYRALLQVWANADPELRERAERALQRVEALSGR